MTTSLSSVVKRGRIEPYADSIPIPPFSDAELTDAQVEVASGTADPTSHQAPWMQVASSILADAELRARRIIAEATERASALLEEAREEAERRIEAAEQAGREEGIREGRRVAELELAQAKAHWQAQLDELAQELRRDHMRRIQDQRSWIAEVAVAAVRRLLRRELAFSPADVAKVVDELLGQVIAASTVYVRVHPSDAEAVRDACPAIALRHGGTVSIQVVPDVSLQPGDCVVASDGVVIDARMEVRVEELSRVLKELAEAFPHGE